MFKNDLNPLEISRNDGQGDIVERKKKKKSQYQ